MAKATTKPKRHRITTEWLAKRVNALWDARADDKLAQANRDIELDNRIVRSVAFLAAAIVITVGAFVFHLVTLG